jgi:hypothetical protein
VNSVTVARLLHLYDVAVMKPTSFTYAQSRRAIGESLELKGISSFASSLARKGDIPKFPFGKLQSATVSARDSVQRKKATDKNARQLKKQNVPFIL